MKITDRRSQQRADLRRRILDTAASMIVREGVESLSLRRLAEKLGYSAGNLYLYFRSKEEILDCLVEASFARLQEALDALPREEPEDPARMLKRALRAYVEFGLRDPHHYRFAFMLRPSRPRRKYRTHPPFDVLRDLVRRCARAGRLRGTDLEMISQGLWATVHGVTSLLIVRPHFPWVERDRLIEHVIDRAVESVTTPKGSLS